MPGKPARGTPELHAWVLARLRAYLAQGGHPSRDAFFAHERGLPQPRVSKDDITDCGAWPALLSAARSASISALDFDDDDTTPGDFEIAEPEPRTAEPRELVELRRTKARVSDLERQLRDTLDALHEADGRAGIADVLRSAPEPQPIVRREIASGLREATAVVLASDLHLEEVVNPAAIEWRNAFDPGIARMRMERMAENVLWLVGMHRSRFQIRDLVLWLGGDMITSYLHEENEETNALAPPQAILFAFELIGGMIRTLLDRGEFERIVVPCNVGNHGRITQYTRPKTRVENSYELILYSQLAHQFANDPRVTFQIAAGSHLYLSIYDETARFLHGDDIRYGGGIGGVTIPIKKALAAYQSFRHADWTACGHWHQLTWHRDFVVNGSLIGYNEFALSIKAEYEDPAQAFFLCDSRRGRTCFSPLWVARSDEPWRRAA